MKYKLVIFDFDGTLADSFPWALSVVDQLADKRGVMRIDRSQIDNMRGTNVKTLMKMHNIPFWKLPLLVRDVRRLMARENVEIPLFAGIGQLLEELAAQGTCLAVVTSNSQQNVQRVLGQKISALVSYYECGVGLFGKRNKFRKILKKSGIAPTDAICIGDESRDIEAARSANLACGAVTWGYARADILIAHAPDVLFASVDELAQALLS